LSEGPQLWLPGVTGVAGTAGLTVGREGCAGLTVGRDGCAGLTVGEWGWAGTDVEVDGPLVAGAALDGACHRARAKAAKATVTAAATARIQRRRRDGLVTCWLVVPGMVV
jgi:hypothetical protein